MEGRKGEREGEREGGREAGVRMRGTGKLPCTFFSFLPPLIPSSFPTAFGVGAGATGTAAAAAFLAAAASSAALASCSCLLSVVE